jgi:hypothetical protein
LFQNWIGKRARASPAQAAGGAAAHARPADIRVVEAAPAALDWSFDTLGWTEVIHTIAGENANSKALAARIGSRYLRQGRLPAPWDIELEVRGQSRDEWSARRPLR